MMMLGSRCGAWAKSGRPTARDYVQDGLIAIWDGIENNGYGVHNPTMTSWKNLIGTGEDIVISGGTVESNCMLFNGNSKCYLDSNKTATTFGLSTNNDITVEVCVELFAYSSSNMYGVILKAPSSSAIAVHYNSQGYMDDKLIMCMNNNNYAGNNFFSSKSRYENNRMTFSKPYNRGTNLPDTMYENGTTCSFYNTTDSVGGSQDDTTIGWRRTNTRPMYGRIYCIRLYKKKLTQQKVMANHAIDLARFNPP